jgi:hypothetical protein
LLDNPQSANPLSYAQHQSNSNTRAQNITGPPKITSDMLTGVKLKKADSDTVYTGLQAQQTLKNIKKQGHGFEVKLDELLNIRSRLKKPKDTGLPTYSSIFKPVVM